jgi:hypothetical protein
MDDYSVSSLTESKNEWCARLVNSLTPPIIQGIKSIFHESWKLCEENVQRDKYLMTFQTFLKRIPQWNMTIIENESKRITETSGCTYLEELISCVHIIHLKALTCVRVCQKQKKVDIDIPPLNVFIHKIYINVARKIYTNIYLFEKNIPPLETQKRNRELECIVKECILDTVRESIPVENILRAYIDETVDKDVEVKEVIENIPIPSQEMSVEPKVQTIAEKIAIGKATTSNAGPSNAGPSNAGPSNAGPSNAGPSNAGPSEVGTSDVGPSNVGPSNVGPSNAGPSNAGPSNAGPSNAGSSNAGPTNVKEIVKLGLVDTLPIISEAKISFSDIDYEIDTKGTENSRVAPKTVEHLEQLSSDKKVLSFTSPDDDDNDKLKIGENINLDILEIDNVFTQPNKLKLNDDDPILDDIVILS